MSSKPSRRGAAGRIQAASEENLQQFQQEHVASISQMELRIKDLGSELSKMNTFQDSNKAALEKYKQHYLEELKESHWKRNKTRLMRGWQRSAPNLRWRNRTDLYSALMAARQSWSPLLLEISILLQGSMQILLQEQT